MKRIGRLGTYSESNSSQTKDGNGRSRSYLCNVPCRSNSCNGQPEEFRVDAQDQDAGGNTVKFHIVMHKKGILTTSRRWWRHWKVSHCCAQGKITRHWKCSHSCSQERNLDNLIKTPVKTLQNFHSCAQERNLYKTGTAVKIIVILTSLWTRREPWQRRQQWRSVRYAHCWNSRGTFELHLWRHRNQVGRLWRDQLQGWS